MDDLFDLAHAFTAKWEGGVTSHPNDPGGLTMYGVSTAFMKDFAATREGRGYCLANGIPLPIDLGSMTKVTKARAAEILGLAFFRGCEDLPPPCAIATYDARVHCGKVTGVKFLQRAANKIADADLAIDGIIGPKTRAACRLKPVAIAREAIREREGHFVAAINRNPKLAVFNAGWHNRTRDLAAYITKLYG